MSDRIQFKMKVISKPDKGTHSVITRIGILPKKRRLVPYFRGRGLTDYVCGNCNHILGEGINLNQIKNIVIKCGNCDSYNEAVIY